MLKKSLMALAAAGALGFGVAANAATVEYTPDTLLASANVGNDAAQELAWMKTVTGVSTLTLTKTEDGENGVDFDLVVEKDDAGNWYIDIDPYTTGYFLLKFGTGQTGQVSHYAFANIAELTKLVWTNAQVNGLAGTGATVGRLSHFSISQTTKVPVPGTLGLLGLGLAGLGLVRRKQKA